MPGGDARRSCAVLQALQVSATRALNSVVYGLLHYYPEDEFVAPEVAGVEPFIDKKGRPLEGRPRWHDPSPAEVGEALIPPGPFSPENASASNAPFLRTSLGNNADRRDIFEGAALLFSAFPSGLLG